MTYNPWADLASREHLVLERRIFPDDDGRVGYCEPGRIVLDHLQRRTQARCTLAHELAHIDLGHLTLPPDTPKYVRTRQEVEADQLAARRLITVEQLGDAILECTPGDWHQLAGILNVDVHTVQARCVYARRHSEAVYLGMRAASREHAA